MTVRTEPLSVLVSVFALLSWSTCDSIRDGADELRFDCLLRSLEIEEGQLLGVSVNEDWSDSSRLIVINSMRESELREGDTVYSSKTGHNLFLYSITGVKSATAGHCLDQILKEIGFTDSFYIHGPDNYRYVGPSNYPELHVEVSKCKVDPLKVVFARGVVPEELQAKCIRR